MANKNEDTTTTIIEGDEGNAGYTETIIDDRGADAAPMIDIMSALKDAQDMDVVTRLVAPGFTLRFTRNPRVGAGWLASMDIETDEDAFRVLNNLVVIEDARALNQMLVRLGNHIDPDDKVFVPVAEEIRAACVEIPPKG